ncbi:hypothetical protein [Alkalihalobacillus sp. BA299]|uniref:hypothetical protein n=1 Tax=Alkalihalobacillus sp. BA299 TaxID=2815938 RepID=UPI001ADC7C5A|nr:hypothetical protein [Alkalihalobacillus sp. BA299]
MLWVIHYDGGPLNVSKLSSPSRKVRAYQSEHVARRSAERIFANYKLKDWEKVEIVPYVQKEA